MEKRLNFSWKSRLCAGGIHLLFSLLVAGLAALLVFGLWYPYPYRDISGGRELFILLVTIDVFIGPVITFAIYNHRKASVELMRDLFFVVLIQFSALGYGLYTVFVARPVHLVFELDRFRVVHSVDVPTELLSKYTGNIDALPMTGPTLLALRPFKNSSEEMDATVAALQGLHLSTRPEFWQPYALSVGAVLKEAKPGSGLIRRFPNEATNIQMALSAVGRTVDSVVYLPLVARSSFWTIFLDPVTAEVVTSMPLDPY